MTGARPGLGPACSSPSAALQHHQVLSPPSIWALRKLTVPWDTGRWGEKDWKTLARLHPRQPVELVLQGCRPLPCPWHSAACSEPQCLLAEPPMTGTQNLSPGRRLWLCAAVAHIKIPKFFQEPRGVAAAPEGGMGRNLLEICVLPFPAGTCLLTSTVPPLG